MRNEVVGEHRQAIEIAELRDAGASEVGRCDLRAFQERDLSSSYVELSANELPAAELLGEGYRRAAGGIDDGLRTGRRARRRRGCPRSRSDRANSAISSCSGSCPSTAAISAASIVGELRPAPGPTGLEPLTDSGRDRVVAGARIALAQGREPARAEIDRVERQPECGQRFPRGADQAGVGILRSRRPWRVQRQADRIESDRVAVDPDVLCSLGDGGRCGAELSH